MHQGYFEDKGEQPMDWKALFGKTYTRRELMQDAQWLLLLIGALQIQLALIIAIIAKAFIVDSIIFAAIGFGFALLSLIRIYWARFASMLIWTGAFIADYYLRQNPFSIFFIIAGVLLIYRMIRFRGQNES